jgi:hypothetical protein
MRVVGLVKDSKPKKTQEKPQENTPKVPDVKEVPKKAEGQ